MNRLTTACGVNPLRNMNSCFKTVAAALLVVGSLQLAGVAHAAVARESSIDKAELAQLSPKVRSDVEARLKPGQTVHGILETMLLNQVSEDFASGRVVATDFSRGDIVVENKNGQMKAFPFDAETLVVKK